LSDEDLGVQRLVRQRRRADDAAPPALGAGVAVEARLPGELLDPGDAEVLGILEIRRAQPPHRLELHEEDVRDRGQDVEVLRVREVVAEEEDVQEVHPPGGLGNRPQGRRRRSVFNIIRCPDLQGQSNTIHFERD